MWEERKSITREVDPEKQAGVRIGLKSPPVLT
jgi:hypothetical protein